MTEFLLKPYKALPTGGIPNSCNFPKLEPLILRIATSIALRNLFDLNFLKIYNRQDFRGEDGAPWNFIVGL